MSALGDILKIFLEKHLIATVIAGVTSLIVLLLLPEDNWMISKLGKYLFLTLVAGIVFLIVQLCIYIKPFVFGKVNMYDKEKNDTYFEDNKYYIEEWLDYADSLSYEEREQVRGFIKSGNKAIVVEDYWGYGYSLRCELPMSDYVVTTKNNGGDYIMKLNDDTYMMVKRLYEKDGKISHFD